MKRFAIYFAVGSAILIIGLALQYYPNGIINGLEERLKETNLPIDERDELQGALSSWKVHSITTFQPLSSILFAVGIIVIVYAVTVAVFSLATSYKLVKAEKENEN